jgi:hypothetical protein
MTDTMQLIIVNAVYPWFGDGEPHVWMTEKLAEAQYQERITWFEVLSAKPPLDITDELMNIEFAVKMTVPADSYRLDQKKYTLDILNDIVNDSDVEIVSLDYNK